MCCFDNFWGVEFLHRSYQKLCRAYINYIKKTSKQWPTPMIITPSPNFVQLNSIGQSKANNQRNNYRLLDLPLRICPLNTLTNNSWTNDEWTNNEWMMNERRTNNEQTNNEQMTNNQTMNKQTTMNKWTNNEQ